MYRKLRHGKPEESWNFDGIGQLWEKIKNNPQEKKRIVMGIPETAIRLYEKFEDEELGDFL